MIGGEFCPMFGLERLDRAMRPAMPPAINAQMMMKITKPKSASTGSYISSQCAVRFQVIRDFREWNERMSDIKTEAAMRSSERVRVASRFNFD